MLKQAMTVPEKKRILFIMTLPPPLHGMSIVCRQIQQSSYINSAFECRYVNSATSRTMTEIGGCSFLTSFRKVKRLLGSFMLLLRELIVFRPELCYLTITCHGLAFLKDAPFVLLCKMFGKRVVIHQHNRGMSTCAHRFPYRWLLPLVYRNATVVLLSWKLYDDVSSVVRREQVRICPNGIV